MGLVLWAMVFVCAAPLPAESAPARRAQPPAPAAPAFEPLTILSLDVRHDERAEEPAVRVGIEADGPVIWTSFRDAEGRLVVELPDSRPGESLEPWRGGEGLVSAVDIREETRVRRPVTLLTIATRSPVEHSLEADGAHLEVRLRPLPGVAASPAEPLPELEPVRLAETDPAPDVAEPAPTAAADPGPAPVPVTLTGTPEEPARAPAPTGVVASRLQGVEVERRGSETVFRVRGDGEFRYSHFVLDGPERFVVDLAGVVDHSPARSVDVASDPVERVRVAQFQSHPEAVARVVFDLARPAVPRLERGSEGLVVRFGTGEAIVPDRPAEPEPELAPEPPPGAAEPSFAAVGGVRESDVVVAGLQSGDDPEPDEEPVPEYVPEAVERTPVMPESSFVEPPPDEAGEEDDEVFEQEVVDFETVDEIDQVEPPAPELEEPLPADPVVEDSPPVDDLEFFRTVTPRREALPPTAPRPDPSDREVPFGEPGVALGEAGDAFTVRTVDESQARYVGEPISIQVRDADLVEVLRTFSQISDLNIVVQPGVGGTVTVDLENVPWDQALQQILKINNLGFEIEGNIMRIAPVAVLQREAVEAQALARARALSVPLTSIMKRLSYADATQVAALLRQQGGLLSDRGSVIVDQRTNTLIIKELPEFMDAVRAVIENLDTPEPLVMIEARIVETTKNFSRTLGIAWSFNGISSAATGNTTGLVFPNNGTIDGGVNLLTGGNNAFINLSLGNVLNTFNLDATLFAAEQEGLINILSAPKVATLNNQQATIQSGQQIPIQTVANNTVTVQFINATLELRVTPQVTAEGTILMDIDIAKREPLPALALQGAQNAPISTKEAQTRVIVRDGGTTVIGGIYEVSTNQGQDRVPGLASVPIVGHLFRNKRRQDENEELLIFITPRVINL